MDLAGFVIDDNAGADEGNSFNMSQEEFFHKTFDPQDWLDNPTSLSISSWDAQLSLPLPYQLHEVRVHQRST